MKYYVYILKSTVNGDMYIGSTEDISRRIALHNKGKVRSTKGYKPWILLGQEEFQSRSEAFKREHFLKNHQQKKLLREKYGHVEKW
ncbi:MAG: GIY-YIG nuclease family protein [bacterium]|nr:GIY-YIG nuclease family protein [bacterium]